MRLKKALFYLIAGMLAGCVPSLHQLYTEKDVVFDEKLLGQWKSNDPDWQWSFEKQGEKNKNYNMTIVDEKQKSGEFNVHLVKLGEMLFLDIHPGEPNWSENDFYKLHIIPAHTFMKVDKLEDIVVLRWMGGEEFNKMLKSDPNLIKHEVADSTVLTASTKELQDFVVKYANDDRVFDDAFELKRIEKAVPDSNMVKKVKKTADKK